MKAADRLLAMAALAGLAGLAACAPRPAPAPPPPPLPVAPPPAPPPSPVAATDWRDLPLTPGDWRYRADGAASEAAFGEAGSALVLACDRGRRQVMISRPGLPGGGTMTVRTSHGVRALAAPAGLPASDPFLDAIAFSRGRFTVEATGLPTLIVPAWPEPARVIEDCRG